MVSQCMIIIGEVIEIGLNSWKFLLLIIVIVMNWLDKPGIITIATHHAMIMVVVVTLAAVRYVDSWGAADL